jgi:hypothetical protein
VVSKRAFGRGARCFENLYVGDRWGRERSLLRWLSTADFTSVVWRGRSKMFRSGHIITVFVIRSMKAGLQSNGLKGSYWKLSNDKVLLTGSGIEMLLLNVLRLHHCLIALICSHISHHILRFLRSSKANKNPFRSQSQNEKHFQRYEKYDTSIDYPFLLSASSN